MQRHIKLIIGMVSLLTAVAAFGDPPQSRAALNLVPPNAEAVVIVPSIKKTSDDLTICFNAMDKAEIIFGGNPANRLRAILGLDQGVDDSGAGAVILPFNGVEEDRLYIIPVNNSKDYLDSNFDPLTSKGEDAYLHHGFARVMYAKEIENHVVIGENKLLVEEYSTQNDFADHIAGLLGDRADKMISEGDIVLYAGSGVSQDLLRSVNRRQRAIGDSTAALRMLIQTLINAALEGVVVLNFNNVGLGIHIFLAVDKESRLGRVAGIGKGSAPVMSKLPHKPFYFATSLDMQAMGGEALFDTLTNGLISLPDWSDGARNLQFAAPSNKRGLGSGLMSDAVLFLGTDRTDEVHQFMRAQFQIGNSNNKVSGSFQFNWEDKAKEIQGVSVDAYEVKVDPATLSTNQHAVHILLFGSAGLRGYVGDADDGVVVTFSRKMSVFTSVMDAIAGKGNLADDPKLNEMRKLLPPHSDLEMFIGVGRLGILLRQFEAMFGGLLPENLVLPDIPADTSPIALGVNLSKGLLEVSLIIPTDVLGIISGYTAEQLQQMDAQLADE